MTKVYRRTSRKILFNILSVRLCTAFLKLGRMRKLRVQFDDPEHGWIGISVNDGIDTVVIDADSKFHSFQSLISALIGLADARGDYKIWWLEEPVKTKWKFMKRQDEIVFEFRRSLTSEPVFKFAGSYQEVCFPFWRALQSLKGRFTKQELEERIQDEFPFSELDRLTTKIQAMKAQT